MEITDQAAASDLRPLLHSSLGRIRWGLMFLVVFVGLGAAAAHFASSLAEFVETPAAGQVGSTMVLSPEDRASLTETQGAQQKLSDDIAGLTRHIDAQRGDLQAILDQLTTLTSRIDILQIPAPGPSAPSAATLPPDKAVLSSVKKRIGRSKPQGPVSVGGAPLIAGSIGER
ncbi:hypothetical protein HAP41_0000044830 [Bradyrhizobium barranii subsp. apii]|uniref:Uncharacterized protein n=1 Tax=Bradyrhizobium barranii subsp. apii TaxID=2819348 RepID=A0A8T5V5V1_9BRAD|nr:hypothetical protein [Bradyrhizobium barranii]UPT87203.1 hypothetical protein HAP41_0000044830 [Bradyrhizobium barranii subsp. apii]